MSAIRYFLPMFDRLEPTTEWCGGYMADIDVLTLEDAAKFASKHAGKEVPPSDFLRAAGRGQIRLKAIVHRTAKVQRHDGGIYCNKGQENENMAPAGAIASLPQSACEHLAATGRASWRTFDGFELMDGVWCRYTKGLLVDGEPDFETSVADCRVMGREVHALADEICDSPGAQTANAVEQMASLDYSKLATPEELIAAFGVFTGMTIDWFNSLKDKPALKGARKDSGQGGRGHIRPPYFCPLEVMQWLISPKRKTGRPLSEHKGWELLERNFSPVYNANSAADPRPSAD